MYTESEKLSYEVDNAIFATNRNIVRLVMNNIIGMKRYSWSLMVDYISGMQYRILSLIIITIVHSVEWNRRLQPHTSVTALLACSSTTQ